MEPNFYQILGVSYRATHDEIKAAYKKLALKYHPDRNQGSQFHEEHFKKIVEAYQTLSDKRRKDTYDLKLFYGAAKATFSGGARTQTSSNQGSRQHQNAQNGQNAQGPEFTNPYRRGMGGTGGRYNYAGRNKEYASRKKDYANEWTIFSWLERPWSMHTYAIVLAVAGSLVMAWLWASSIKARRDAEYFYAIGDYAMAIETDRQYAPAYFERARLYFQEGKFDKSRADLNAAIRFSDNQDPQYYLLRAELNKRDKDFKAAETDLVAAGNLLPDSDSIFAGLGFLQIRYLEDPLRAEPNLRRALNLNRRNTRAWMGLGLVNLKNQHPVEAIPNFEQALRTDSTSHELLYFLGVSKLAAGRTIEGCNDLQAAARAGNMLAANYMSKHCQ